MPLIQAKLLSTPVVLTLVVAVILAFGLLITGTDTLANAIVDWTDTSEDTAITAASPDFSSALERSLPTETLTSRSISAIGNRLVEALPRRTPFKYEFHVIDDNSVNAFAMPGGVVFIHTGLLRATTSSDQIAAVLAHEIVHVEHRHGLKKIYANLGRLALFSMVFGVFTDSTAELSSGLSFLKYSREMETEADLQGSRLLENAGYPKAAMVEMLNMLAKINGSGLTWLSSHPDSAQRARRVANQKD